MLSSAIICRSSAALRLPVLIWVGLFSWQPLNAEESAKIEWALVVHGGAISAAEKFSPQQRESRRRSVRHALSLGAEILSTGGRSLDAVEAVIKALEDDPLFNAGRGAVFTRAGTHELDASIMDGRRRDCGAVASVRTVKNPIQLARLVMEKTEHVLLVSEGADQFAQHMQVAIVENQHFDTPETKAAWKKTRQTQAQRRGGGSTVGCVALDMLGNLAAGTSTGGLTDKMAGRVGDSPIIGAGTFADNDTCAISCTGWGEHFIRHAVAHDVSARMAYGSLTLQESVDAVFSHRLKPGWGGLIAVSHLGEIYWKYNTADMARAAADSTGRFEIAWGVEAATEADQNVESD